MLVKELLKIEAKKKLICFHDWIYRLMRELAHLNFRLKEADSKTHQMRFFYDPQLRAFRRHCESQEPSLFQVNSTLDPEINLQFELNLMIQDNFTWLASLFWMSTVEVLWGLTRVGRSRGRSETDWGWGECGPGWWLSWIFETGVSEVNSFIALLQFQQKTKN